MMMEQEMKLPVASLVPIRERARQLGGQERRARHFERNLVLDAADGRLATGSQLLRLRTAGGETILTFKGAPSFEDGVKSREEIECTVDDGEALLAVLKRLGFEAVRRYEKFRETWQLQGVEVALDETPAGCFVEIEGPAAVLPEVARRLGLDPAMAVAGSYLKVWEDYRESHPEAGQDMVFP